MLGKRRLSDGHFAVWVEEPIAVQMKDLEQFPFQMNRRAFLSSVPVEKKMETTAEVKNNMEWKFNKKAEMRAQE